MTLLAAAALVLWLALLLAPWQPWRCRETLAPEADDAREDDPVGGRVTVLIPARNEADVIGGTLEALATAAPDAPVIVVDDQSEDGTAEQVRNHGNANVCLLGGTPPPAGWTGKLWALEQGLKQVETPRVLLLDADIRLAPGLPAALINKARAGYSLVSVLAEPSWQGIWARWLMPAYVYFFQLVYPFALANKPGAPVAAAAGGVVLVDCDALRRIGGFSAWRDTIIDDCTLARHMKHAGHANYLGLSRAATSTRQQGFRSLATMVARTAYVQLRESPAILVTVTLLMLLVYAVPLAALVFAGPARWLGLAAWVALTASYVPTLAYYNSNIIAAPLLPAVATLYLGMTWFSALRSWFGTRSAWKGRRYLTAQKGVRK